MAIKPKNFIYPGYQFQIKYYLPRPVNQNNFICHGHQGYQFRKIFTTVIKPQFYLPGPLFSSIYVYYVIRSSAPKKRFTMAIKPKNTMYQDHQFWKILFTSVKKKEKNWQLYLPWTSSPNNFICHSHLLQKVFFFLFLRS